MAEARIINPFGFAQTLQAGVQTGLGIARTRESIGAQRAATELAQQRFQLQQQQLQVERQRQAEIDRQNTLRQQLDRTDKLLDAGIKKGFLKTNPDFMRRLVDSSNLTSSQLFPGSPNYDFNTILSNSEEFEKDWNAHQLMLNEGMEEEAAQFLREISPKYQQKFERERIEEAREEIGLTQAARVKERIARRTFAPERFPGATMGELSTAAQIALEDSVAAGATFLREQAKLKKAAIPKVQRPLQVNTTDEQGNPVTAFLDPVTLETRREVPRDPKTKTTKTTEIGLTGFPGWFQKAEITDKRDAEGNLILKPVGPPFQKEVPIIPTREEIPVGIGGETGEVAGPFPEMPQEIERAAPAETRAAAEISRREVEGFVPQRKIELEEFINTTKATDRYKNAIKGLKEEEITQVNNELVRQWARLFNEGIIPIGAIK